jgi:uncharacterized protein (DUF1697 family)
MRVAALLRGVNLGPHRRISMAELRRAVEELGHADVETYGQSGNVLFTPRGGRSRGLERPLAAAIREATGMDVGVVVRSGRELAHVVEHCPYAVEDPTRLVVAFFGERMTERRLGLADRAAYAPDELTVDGAHAYVSLPGGQARSKLMEALGKAKLSTVMTVRNWRTVTAIADRANIS